MSTRVPVSDGVVLRDAPGAGRGGEMRRIRGNRRLLPCSVVAGFALVVVAAILAQRNWMHGAAWTGYDVALVTVRLLSAVLGLGVGSWWWWRAPANPTGRLLYVAAAADLFVLIGYSSPGSRWAADLGWVSWLTEPLVVIIVLSWPTGRPSRRLVRTVTWWTLAGAALVLVGGVFNRRPNPPADWPDPFEALFTVPTVFRIVDPVQALATQALPAAIVLVVLVRRRRAVPPAVRPLLTPITTAGVLVCASMLTLHLGFQIFWNLLGNGPTFTGWQFSTYVGSYFMVGFVALGVLVGARRRRRAVSLGHQYREVDLRSAPAVVTPSAAAAAITGDPTAMVRYRRLDGTWIDAVGTVLPEVAADRRLVPVLDATGSMTAALEVAASTHLSSLLADLAVSVIAAQSANERATAVADARRADVRLRSRALVAATDRGRRQLERDLHDGAQQLLVGLALTAGLAARRGELDAGPLIDHIGAVRSEILCLVDQATPAALAGGLAGALDALASICPLPVIVDADGDLPADDPLALPLYLVAGEALTNAVKHSGAGLVRMRLDVDAARTELYVSDDGIGAVTDVPPGIASRLIDVGGSATITSPPLGGTVLDIQIRRPADAVGVSA
ncbi:MAG: histidine kinase [Allobranchiibius sp.]